MQKFEGTDGQIEEGCVYLLDGPRFDSRGRDVSTSKDLRPVDEVLFEELSQSQYRQRTGAGGIGAARIRRERRENKRSVL